jgi:8-oxo-dGTP diphosphatase
MKNKTDSILRMPVAVDLVILTIHEGELAVLLVKRAIAPYQGSWALPGGFVRQGEDLETAAIRELQEETGLKSANTGHMEQLGTFGAVARDPRERILSVAYLAFVPDLPAPVAGGDAGDAGVFSVRELGKKSVGSLAFDHADILKVAVERTCAKLEYTALATRFCKPTFTINELRKVYEAVWGLKLDPANFHRKITKTDGFLVSTKEMSQGDSGRPAQLFTKGRAQFLYPPLLRPPC